MIDAFLYGAMIAARSRNRQTVYAFADVSADADAPDIVIVAEGGE